MAFGNVMGQGINLLNQYGNLVEVRDNGYYTPTIGSEIEIAENNIRHTYIIVHTGIPNTSIYDSSCNGIWVMRKKCIGVPIYSDVLNNLIFYTTAPNIYLQNEFYNSLEPRVKNSIKQVKVPYYNGTTTYVGNNGYSAKIIVGSPLEYNQTPGMPWPTYGTDGSTLSYFADVPAQGNKLITTNDSNQKVEYVLRQPMDKGNNMEALTQYRSITEQGVLWNTRLGIEPDFNPAYFRPMFILPNTYFTKKSLYTLDGQFIMDVPEA